MADQLTREFAKVALQALLSDPDRLSTLTYEAGQGRNGAFNVIAQDAWAAAQAMVVAEPNDEDPEPNDEDPDGNLT